MAKPADLRAHYEELVRALAPMQRRFVEEYLVDLNGSQAATRAGYSEKTARVKAAQLMALPHVMEAIEAGMALRAERTEITQDRVLQELARVGFSDIRKLFNEAGLLKRPEEWDADTAAFVASIEVVVRKVPGSDEDEVEHVHKVKLWDKNSALEKIARHLGMLTQKVEHNVSATVEHKGAKPTDLTDEELAAIATGNG